jgi:hypothetical protein
MGENKYIVKNYGKWSQLDVPHKGWECIDIEDLGSLSTICEMCEAQPIRYVHYMKHPDYKEILGVGCVCAGNMENDYLRAKQRDDFMKSRMDKRKRWLSRNWKISSNGNDFIKSDGYIVVMKQNGILWSATIAKDNSNDWKWSRRKYESEDMAKLAAFDYLTKLLAEDVV